MLRTEYISPELLKTLHQLMEIESLQNFRLVGGTALALQFGHRESIDIDMFSFNYFPADKICAELTNKFNLKKSIKARGGIMIRTSLNDVKVDIIDSRCKFIRDVVSENGIRMAHTEEIAAMKIKMTCDPFTGRKTKKDLADIATLLDVYSIKEMVGFFKEKYPTMAPYVENVILEMKDFDVAELKSKMPKMFNRLTWEKIKQKILNGLKDYFDALLKDRELELKRSGRKNNGNK